MMNNQQLRDFLSSLPVTVQVRQTSKGIERVITFATMGDFLEGEQILNEAGPIYRLELGAKLQIVIIK